MTEHDRKLQETLADTIGETMKDVTTERPIGSGSVAEQMVGVASTIKSIHRDLDALQADFGRQLDALRKRLGGKG